MTPEQFIIWLQGFVAGSNNYNLTPSGWDELKDKLSQVELRTTTKESFERQVKQSARQIPNVPPEDRQQLKEGLTRPSTITSKVHEFNLQHFKIMGTIVGIALAVFTALLIFIRLNN